MYRRMVVGIDGSKESCRALDAAIELARAHKAELFLISVEELSRYPAARGEVEDEQRIVGEFFRGVQKEAVDRVNGAGLVAHHDIRAGRAAQALPQYAQEVHADLLIVGRSGHSGVLGLLLGSTADKVADHAPCSVLIVR